MPTSLVPAPITSATVDRLSLTAETVRGTAHDMGFGCFVCCVACFEAE